MQQRVREGEPGAAVYGSLCQEKIKVERPWAPVKLVRPVAPRGRLQPLTEIEQREQPPGRHDDGSLVPVIGLNRPGRTGTVERGNRFDCNSSELQPLQRAHERVRRISNVATETDEHSHLNLPDATALALSATLSP